jgi:serine/threonine protein kinase
MSPEQAHGDALSPQSDLYALGILLYEMLTGLKPFYGSNNTEILAKVTRGKYTPPKRINPEITFRLGRIIKKLLRKDKNRRYRNAAALIHDLEKCISWKVRSRKKEVIAETLENLDKTNYTTTEDTIKSTVLDKSTSWGWTTLRYSLIAAFIVCGYILFKQFSKKELGYIYIENPVRQMELAINNKPHKPVTAGSKIYGPFLKGSLLLEASDPMANSSFVAYAIVSPNDTTRIKVELPVNPGLSGLKIVTDPLVANIALDGKLLPPIPEGYIDLNPGWHEVEIRKAGYQTIHERRFFRAAESYILSYCLIEE